jgi:hypothetical protein
VRFTLISHAALSPQNVTSTRDTTRWYAACKRLASAVQNKPRFCFRQKDSNMRTLIALSFVAAIAFAANAVAGIGGGGGGAPSGGASKSSGGTGAASGAGAKLGGGAGGGGKSGSRGGKSGSSRGKSGGKH